MYGLSKLILMFAEASLRNIKVRCKLSNVTELVGPNFTEVRNFFLYPFNLYSEGVYKANAHFEVFD